MNLPAVFEAGPASGRRAGLTSTGAKAVVALNKAPYSKVDDCVALTRESPSNMSPKRMPLPNSGKAGGGGASHTPEDKKGMRICGHDGCSNPRYDKVTGLCIKHWKGSNKTRDSKGGETPVKTLFKRSPMF